MRTFLLTALALALAGCGRNEPATEAKPAATAPPDTAVPANSAVPGADASANPGPGAATPAAAARVVYATDESLKVYNKALKAWIDSTSYLPQNVKELSTLRGCPKPPPPPPGRTLVFDQKTWAVHME